MDNVRTRLLDDALEVALDAWLVELELRLTTVVVQRRVHHLEHRHPISAPALEARPTAVGVIAPREEVRHVVAAANLLVHQLLDVRHQSTDPQRTKPRPDVEDTHAGEPMRFPRARVAVVRR